MAMYLFLRLQRRVHRRCFCGVGVYVFLGVHEQDAADAVNAIIGETYMHATLLYTTASCSCCGEVSFTLCRPLYFVVD